VSNQTQRPFAEPLARLRHAGVRPTRQRLALAKLLFADCDRHVTAEGLHAEAADAGVRVSLATVYNTLNEFTRAGLLREIAVDTERCYFDTNTTDHHHFYFEESKKLQDIPAEALSVQGIPDAPAGTRLARVDVVVRVTEGD
jgi:Fur family transcriptional regulator, iron response regulator